MNDSWGASLIWGRIGAAVLIMASLGLQYFGFTFSAEDQATAFKTISELLAGLAAIMVVISKVRSSKKTQ